MEPPTERAKRIAARSKAKAAAPATRKRHNSSVPAKVPPLPKRFKGSVNDVLLLLNEDTLDLVVEYLKPREILRMVLRSKALQARITVRMIVKSVSMGNDSRIDSSISDAKDTLTELYGLLKCRAIHNPSPMRVLRLVNGRLCEVCLKNKVIYPSRGQARRHGYGVFLCETCMYRGDDSCLKGLPFELSHQYRQIADDPRVAGKWDSQPRRSQPRFFLFHQPFVNRCGEHCGPRLSYSALKHIAEDRSLRPVESMVAEVAPDQDNQGELLEAYESFLEEDGTEPSKNQEAVHLHKATILSVISRIQELVEEPWRELAMECRATGWTGEAPCFRFTHPSIDRLMLTFIIDPSESEKENAISDVAESINRLFSSASRLVDFSFLDESIPLQGAAKEYLLSKFPQDLRSLVFLPEFFYGTGAVSELAKEGKLFELTLAMLPKYPDLGAVLLATAFDAHPVRLYGLADTVWRDEYRKVWSQEKSESSILDMYSKTFAVAQFSFAQLATPAKEYLTFLESKNVDWMPFAQYQLGQKFSFKYLHQKDYTRLYTIMQGIYRTIGPDWRIASQAAWNRS